MKAIFVADLSNTSASGIQRLWAMEECGIEVFVFNKEKYKSILGNWAGYIARSLKEPRLLRDCNQLEQELINLCERVHPEIVWIEWAKEIRPKVLLRIKSIISRPLLISFQDDNPWGDRQKDKWIWKQYFKTIPEFDLHLVKRQSDVDNLRALGAKSCRLWEHGIYQPLFFPSQTLEEKKYPVSFVGTCLDKREYLIRYLLENGIPIHVFGNLWQKKSDLPRLFPTHFHPAVEGKAYADVIRQSQICLGLVSHSNHDEWTMRTYEVPGCAGLLLAERTPKHEELFREGYEAEFFSTPEECMIKLMNLLPKQEQCRIMGEASYYRFVKNNLTIEARMLVFLKTISAVIS